MNKIVTNFLRTTLMSLSLILISMSSRASHIVGCDMYYTWQSGNTYKVTVILYGDCGISSASAFSTLHSATPQVCVYNGGSLIATLSLVADAASSPVGGGTEITPVCPDSASRTQCTNTSYPIPGIKKFVYNTTYTFPGTSSVYRMVYTGNNGGASASGRAAAITNLSATTSGTGSTMQLIDTLNNTGGNNTSPILTVVPTPFFCKDAANCYTPGAIDPDLDSLSFDLVTPTQGTTSCGTVGGPCTYNGALSAWPGQPLTAATPLQTNAPPAYNFDPTNGQLCFYSTVLQRSVVVYNIREFRGGIFVGSSQREMTFLTLACTYTPPSVSPPTTSGVITSTDPTHFHMCGGNGAFSFSINPVESNPLRHITCTASGLPPGFAFTVVNNNTASPVCTVFGNSTTTPPGIYTFFITLRDDNCPIASTNTTPYTVQIYPVPTISITKISDADCVHGAVILVNAGGTGAPWTVKTTDSSLVAPADTVNTHTVSAPFYDTLLPGSYGYTIYTSVTNECSDGRGIALTSPPRLNPNDTFAPPTFCGANDGFITIRNLNPGGTDSIIYTYNKIGSAIIVTDTQIHVVNTLGEVTLGGLVSGDYGNIIVRYGLCTSLPLPLISLVDSPFHFRTINTTNASKCGFCDGLVILSGLHPGQIDSIAYTYTPPVGPTEFDTIAYYVGPDSAVIMSGQCKGSFNTFVIWTQTNNVCKASPTLVENVNAPSISSGFDSLTHLGCHGDTMVFTNTSTPPVDLHYSWFFGDGTTSNAVDPIHVYTNTAAQTYTVKLFISNTKCIDSTIATRTFDNTLGAAFTMNPPSYLCQQMDTLKFTNSTGGTSPSYIWYFGDGQIETTSDPNHIYANAGTYQVMLVAQTYVPCYDTVIKTITVDSTVAARIAIHDSVTTLCKGQPVTLTGIYARGGDIGNTWSVTDGFTISNINDLQHSFDGVGTFTVNLDARFRACPEQQTSLTFQVYDYPTIYIGPDMTICPGSNPIQLADVKNAGNAKAKWHWNTEETTSSITVVKPGDYVASVTVDGCTTSDTITVAKDCYMDIPNVFTPNGDGINDYFFPRRFLTRGVVTFKMNIYNRWGALIYETANTDGQGWDGALNGTQQTSGVYVYIIDATYKDGQIEHHQGNITLLR